MSDTDTAENTATAKVSDVDVRIEPRLKTRHRDEIAPKLFEELGLDNKMQVPTLTKIVVNVGLGEAINDSKALDGAIQDLMTITGQRPRINRARKSIANFKLREGQAIGAKVTLRGPRMWEFFDRLISTALPRIRDFRGLPRTSFDGNGNYTFGLVEQLVFAEINYDDVTDTRGMDVTIVTSTRNDDHARALLAAYNFPFKKDEQ